MRVKTEINNSGWFGKIPDSWSMVPLPRLFSCSKGMTVTKADLVDAGAPVVNYAQVHSKENNKFGVSDELIKYVPEDFVPKGLEQSRTGSFIFACTSEDLAGCGDCIYNDSNQALNPGGDTLLLSPIGEADNKYFAYLFSTDMWRWQVRRDLVDVKVFHVNQCDLHETYVVVPPHSEQHQIVSYLDKRCAAISEDEAKRREVIGKLKEYKKSLIARTVTKGLDPTIEMKDSSIEWVGAIPLHWRMAYTGMCFEEEKRKNTDLARTSALQFNDGTIVPKKKQPTTDEELDEIRSYRIVDPGSVVINNLNLNYDLKSKRVGLVKQPGAITSAYIVLKPKSVILSEYASYLFKGYDACKAFHGMGIGLRQTLSWGELRKYKQPLPPIDEQQKIVDYLNERCSAIDEAIMRQEQLIEKLDEYRKSIIHHAVTGKINCMEG